MTCECGHADECDGEHATYYPLQNGGMCSVDVCAKLKQTCPSQFGVTVSASSGARSWYDDADGVRRWAVDWDEFPLPHWATGVSSTPVVGSQLCTRDGRRMGNAVIIRCEKHAKRMIPLFICVTDVGTTMTLTGPEIAECFHPPHFIMDPARHPGVKCLTQADASASKPVSEIELPDNLENKA